MPRDIPIGNGALLVTFDDDHCLRDLFYPHAGMENHTAGHRNRLGVWVDGRFSWVDREWSPGLGYLDESLVSSVSAGHPALEVRLSCSDAVDYEEPVYIKRIVIENLAGREREFRLFFNHDLHIRGYPDGSLGSSWHPWVQGEARLLPIQEDGTGLVLWALWSHFDRYRDIEFAAAHYEHMVKRCADFMVSCRDGETGLPLPSYDLWEERWGIHTFTVAAVHAGLRAAERFSLFFGEKARAEAYARAAGEIKAVEDRLSVESDIGGIARYERGAY